MAATVAEIMNRELFTVRPDQTLENIRISLMALEITAAPVVDESGHPMGIISLRDLIDDDRNGFTAEERMSYPPRTLRQDATIMQAARKLAQGGLRHAVVVDKENKAVGFISTLDVLRAMVSLPVTHPRPFPHLDGGTGLIWTDDAPLDLKHVSNAPDGPGVWVLVFGGYGTPATIVWAEGANNVCSRLIDVLSLPQSEPLATWLTRAPLYYRAAAVADAEHRDAILRTLRERIGASPLPSGAGCGSQQAADPMIADRS